MPGAAFASFVNPRRAEAFAQALLSPKGRMANAIDRAVNRAAIFLAAEVRKGIRAQAPGGQAFKPLAESTKRRKGSSKALIDLGDLLRSIKAHRVGPAAFIVGVHRNVTAKDGMRMVLIAKVHEEGFPTGAAIALKAMEGATPKRRPVIPARPYLRPTMELHRDKMVEMVGQDTGDAFFGQLKQISGL